MQALCFKTCELSPPKLPPKNIRDWFHRLYAMLKLQEGTMKSHIPFKSACLAYVPLAGKEASMCFNAQIKHEAFALRLFLSV